MFLRENLPEPSFWALCWSWERLEVGSTFRLEVVLLTCLEVEFMARPVAGFMVRLSILTLCWSWGMVSTTVPDLVHLVALGPDWFCTRTMSEIIRPESTLVWVCTCWV